MTAARLRRRMSWRPATGTLQRKKYSPDSFPSWIPRPEDRAAGRPELHRPPHGLANWLADPRNPLTTRVMVNRIWHYHFGQRHRATRQRFRSDGRASANPQLLDYLAAIRREWLEHQEACTADHALERLPGVVRRSRRKRARRIRKQAAMAIRRHRRKAKRSATPCCTCSGLLNRRWVDRAYSGLPAGVECLRGGWNEKDAGGSQRRSVYVFVKAHRGLPDVRSIRRAESAGKLRAPLPFRDASQALMLMNDRLVLEWSRALAGRVLNDGGLTPDSRWSARIAWPLAAPDTRSGAVLDFLARQQRSLRTAGAE